MDSQAVSPCRAVDLPIGDASCTPLVSSAGGGFLKRWCMDCGAFMGVKATSGITGDTHGICRKCFAARIMREGLCG